MTESIRTDQETQPDIDRERPPVFSTWKRWYAFLVAELVVLILVFRWLTVIFR